MAQDYKWVPVTALVEQTAEDGKFAPANAIAAALTKLTGSALITAEQITEAKKLGVRFELKQPKPVRL